MEKIHWKPEYSVGDLKMDSQHQIIINMINSLIDHLPHSHDADYIDEQLTRMTEYTFMHLRDEEELLSEIEYPQFNEHATLHDNYRMKVTEFCDAVSIGIDILPTMLNYLSNWWQHHIRLEDQKYHQYVK